MSSRDRVITQKLTDWFSQNARDLPWRGHRSGYSALVSEAMLQQTQVSRVIDKYLTFMQQFPTVQALADASEQQVLAAWQGLGYYRRARHLHAAAKMIVNDCGGKVPRDVDHLLALPGVGRYTAGAIASIAYNQPQPIVDGNVHRVLARLCGEADFTHADAWNRAEQLVQQAQQPGVFNEAMMELGATICTPAAPKCRMCPLKANCIAKRHGSQGEIPPPRRAANQRAVHHHAVIITRREKLLLEQRPSSGLWSNMWQVPTIEADTPLSATAVAGHLPMHLTTMKPLESFVHITTHRRITFHTFTARTRHRRGVWRALDELQDLPMSNAQQRIVALAARLSPQQPVAADLTP